MKLYAGIDLHSNNSVIVIYNPLDKKVVFKKRLPNDRDEILSALEQYKSNLECVTFESTYNWYWLSDLLHKANYTVKMANVSAMQGLKYKKHTNDFTDALWLADMTAANRLATGYIHPSEQREQREHIRQRMKLVQVHTKVTLIMQSMLTRYANVTFNSNALKSMDELTLAKYIASPDLSGCFLEQQKVLQQLSISIQNLEKQSLKMVKGCPKFQGLRSISGIGEILSQVILFETGPVNRFKNAKHYASYCRKVNTVRESNGKNKGQNNRKNGNQYLSWAFNEAAVHAIRSNPIIKKFYQRKCAKVHKVSALNAVAHKLALASYYILKDGVIFDVNKAF